MSNGRGKPPGPVLIGGAARSGTHAMGRLVSAHPRYHLIATEARFHCAPEGLPDLLAGRVRPERFVELLRGPWWSRGYTGRQGLQRICRPKHLEAAVAALERELQEDPWSAARHLVGALLDETAARAGKPSWAEVSGWNVQRAPTLVRLLPRARVINMVRDGRSVVAGHLNKTSLTDDPEQALQHWAQRVRAAQRAIRSLPPGTVLCVDLDDLAARDRERSYRRVVEFLEVDDDRAMRAHFTQAISGDAANVGRWRERMASADALRIDRRYRRLVRELRREGIGWVPAPEGPSLRARAPRALRYGR